MTLVFGARCCDGVVILTDMKIVSKKTGAPVFLRYESKISGVFKNIVFGYSGDVNMYEIYVNYVIGDTVRKRDDPNDVYTDLNFVKKLHENMVKIRTTLIREGKILLLRVLVGRQFPGNGNSDLHLVTSNISSEQLSDNYNNRIDTYKVVGDSEIVANNLIAERWHPGMTMIKFAELAYCIIRYIEEERVSEAVGFGDNKPPVRFLTDGENIDTGLDNEQWDQFKESYTSCKEHFNDIKKSLQ